MIGKLKGIIDSYGEDSIILDVNCRAPASRRRLPLKRTSVKTRFGCSAF